MIKGFQAPQRPKHNKNSSRYDCCAIFQIFWSPTIDLCVKQHQASCSCQEPCCLVNMWQMKTNIYVQEMTDVVISVVFWVAKTLVGRPYKTQIIHYNMCSKISSKYQMFDILQLHGFLVWSLKKSVATQFLLKSVSSDCPKSADWIFQQLKLSCSDCKSGQKSYSQWIPALTTLL